MLAAFQTVDWVIVICYLAGMVGVGIYVKGYIKRVDDYIVAGRAVGFGLAIATMIGTELGLVTIAYMGQLGFTGGFAGFHVAVIFCATSLVIGLTGFVIYRLRKLRVMTIPEFYRKRYGNKTRLVGGIILVLAGVLNMGMFLKAGAAFIGGLTGLTDTTQINLIMTVLLGIVFAYTIMGGMVSVVITDFLQFILVGGSLLVVTLFCLSSFGWDFSKVVDRVTEYRTQQGEGTARKGIVSAAANLEKAEQQTKDSPGAILKAQSQVEKRTAELEALTPARDRALAAYTAAWEAWHRARKELDAVEKKTASDGPEYKAAQAAVSEAAKPMLGPTAELKEISVRYKAAEARLIEAKAALKEAEAGAKTPGTALADAKEAFASAADEFAGGKAGEDAAEAAFNPFHGKGFGSLYVLWMAFVALTGYSLWQPATMRALMARSPSVAKKAYVGSSIGFLVRFMIPMFWGICAFIFVMENPDLKERFFPAVGAPEDTLKATSIFLAQILPVGVGGFVLAGLLASFMSTHDSYLIAWSSSIVQDVIAPLRNDKLSSRTRVILTRVFIFVIGMFLLLWGLWFPMEGDLWGYLAITGTIYFSGALAVVVGGLYWKRASSTGAVLALCAGLLAVLGILPWGKWAKQWDVKFFKYMTQDNIGMVVFALAIICMVAGSLLFPDRKTEESAS